MEISCRGFRHRVFDVYVRWTMIEPEKSGRFRCFSKSDGFLKPLDFIRVVYTFAEEFVKKKKTVYDNSRTINVQTHRRTRVYYPYCVIFILRPLCALFLPYNLRTTILNRFVITDYIVRFAESRELFFSLSTQCIRLFILLHRSRRT